MLRKRFVVPRLKASDPWGTATFSRWFAIILLVLLSVPCFADDFVPGQIFVKFRDEVVVIKDVKGPGVFSVDKAEIMSDSIRSLNAKYKVKNIRKIFNKEHKTKRLRSGRIVELPDLSGIMLLELPVDVDVNAAVDEYQRDPSVEMASPNYYRQIFSTMPSDPYYISGEGSSSNFPNQWGLYKIGLTPTGSGESGWDITTGESTIKVAVVDTGVDYNHDDLKTRVNSLEGNNFAAGYGTSDPMDDNGHGTHVSGIIGAATNNGKGVAGVDWSCRIIPIKCFDLNGSANDLNIIPGIQWAVSKDADVISMSFGASSPGILGPVMAYAATSDAVLVAAAGNSNTSAPQYPASFTGVIAVAATEPADHKSSFSNYGSWVHVSAPGGDDDFSLGPNFYLHEIFSTWPFVTDKTSPHANNYRFLEGTSMATPFVSGLAALVRGKYPLLTPAQVATRIEDYSDNIDAYNTAYSGQLGKGRINAFLALGGLWARFSSPASGANVFGYVSVKGTATGEGFDHFVVEIGQGTNPTSWLTLGTSTIPVLNGPIFTVNTTGQDGYYTLRMVINDLPTTEARLTVHVGSGDNTLISGNVEYGPNPFNPKNGQYLIKYDLDSNSDIYIYFFDITGNLVLRKFYRSGTEGGKSSKDPSSNRVYWDGKNDFGEVVANGVYIFKIVSEGRMIGKGKIIVLK